MTQKELLYLEDAIKHENNTIAIVDNIIENLEDESLIKFLEKESKKHSSMKEKLIKQLEEKSNE